MVFPAFPFSLNKIFSTSFKADIFIGLEFLAITFVLVGVIAVFQGIWQIGGRTSVGFAIGRIMRGMFLIIVGWVVNYFLLYLTGELSKVSN